MLTPIEVKSADPQYETKIVGVALYHLRVVLFALLKLLSEGICY